MNPILFNSSLDYSLLISYSKTQLTVMLSGYCSVKALASHRFDPGSIPGVGILDGHVVTKSDRWISFGHSGFLPHEDHPIANIGAKSMIYISCITCFVIVVK